MRRNPVDPVFLEGGIDPELLGSTPGQYYALSGTSGYTALKVLAALGGASMVGERYMPSGQLLVEGVVPALRRKRKNPKGHISMDPSRFQQILDRDYRNWRETWWREAIQNSVDAKASHIRCWVKETETEVEVGCEDDGRGMSRETLLGKFLMLRGSGKEKEETPEGGFTGGFGKAKELLILPWKWWRVETRDSVAWGTALEYEEDAILVRVGTRLTVGMPLDSSTTVEAAVSYIKKCWIPHVEFAVNDQPVAADLRGGQIVHTLEGGGDIHHLKGQDLVGGKEELGFYGSARMLVRVNGLYMFSILQPAGVKGTLTLEITRPSVEVLTAFRDGFREWRFGDEVQNWLSRLAADTRSALQRGKIFVFRHEGTGKFKGARKEEVEAALVSAIQIKPQAEGKKLPSDVVGRIGEILEALGKGSFGDETGNMRVPLEIVTTIVDVPMLGPKHAENMAKQLSWEPDLLVVNKEGKKPPRKFMPDTMQLSIRKLLRFWAEICRWALIRLNCGEEYGVGFVFKEGVRAEFLDGGDSSLSGSGGKGGDKWLLLNPLVNPIGGFKGEIYKLTDRNHLEALYAIAIHEVTHLVDGEDAHNEAFAAAFTRNVGICMKGARQLEKIRKAVAASGGEGGPGELGKKKRDVEVIWNRLPPLRGGHPLPAPAFFPTWTSVQEYAAWSNWYLSDEAWTDLYLVWTKAPRFFPNEPPGGEDKYAWAKKWWSVWTVLDPRQFRSSEGVYEAYNETLPSAVVSQLTAAWAIMSWSFMGMAR